MQQGAAEKLAITKPIINSNTVFMLELFCKRPFLCRTCGNIWNFFGVCIPEAYDVKLH
jgi:hypothetical protein